MQKGPHITEALIEDACFTAGMNLLMALKTCERVGNLHFQLANCEHSIMTIDDKMSLADEILLPEDIDLLF